jgi:hypothetical protein
MRVASQNDNHIPQSCGVGSIKSPTIIYEDNAACVAQMQIGYIKSNITKHTAPKLFYPHELQKSGEINILQVKSCDNLADLFMKSLPTSTFQIYIHGIGMRRLQDLQESGGSIFMNCSYSKHHIILFFP